MPIVTRPLLGLAVALLVALPPALVSVGCDMTECGDGTIEVDGTCEPLQPANCTGEGVRFVNGRCVPDFDEVCGPGTVQDEDTGRCVSAGPIADPEPDAGADLDTGVDVVADADAGDVPDEEVITFTPECADDLEPGSRVCIWGRAFDFIDGTPLPGSADPPLEVQLKDIQVILGGDPLSAVGETLLEPGGYFILPAVDFAEPPREILLFLGEAEEGDTLEGPGETWQRAITATFATSAAVDEEGDLELFSVPRSAVAGWNAELGRPPLPTLETNGFLLARILDGTTGEPIEGGELVYNGAQDVDIRYFDDANLSSFGGDSTGPSGTAMMEGSGQTDTCTAAAPGFIPLRPLRCGVSPGRVSILLFVMTPDE